MKPTTPMRLALALSVAIAAITPLRASEDPPSGPLIVSLSAEVPGVLTVGDMFQLVVEGTFDNGTVLDVTNDEKMVYSTMGGTGLSVSADGSGQAVEVGRHALVIRYSTVWAAADVFSVVEVRAIGDTDGDHLPDAYEIAQGFNPLVPGDGVLDLDQDT